MREEEEESESVAERKIRDKFRFECRNMNENQYGA